MWIHPPALAVYSLQQKPWSYKNSLITTCSAFRKLNIFKRGKTNSPQEQILPNWLWLRYSNQTASPWGMHLCILGWRQGGKEEPLPNQESWIYLPLHWKNCRCHHLPGRTEQPDGHSTLPFTKDEFLLQHSLPGKNSQLLSPPGLPELKKARGALTALQRSRPAAAFSAQKFNRHLRHCYSPERDN